MEKLDYLEDIGISGDGGSIWLSPFYESGGRDLGYDVVNHTAVDGDFGTMQDMEELLEELDKRGEEPESDLANFEHDILLL